MNAVSARAARAGISALLDAAEEGRSTLIIRNSKACAVIAPVPPREQQLAYDPEEVRWYRARGATHKIGFTGATNAAFLALSRDERARILAVCAVIAAGAPILVTTL